MSGIYASPVVEHGKTIWVIKNMEDKQVVAKGKTISEAIKNYEEKEVRNECSE